MSRRAEYRSGAFAAGGDPGDSGAAVNCLIDWDPHHGAWVARGFPHEGAAAFEARSDSSPAAALLIVRVKIKDAPMLSSERMNWDDAVTCRADLLNNGALFVEQAVIVNTATLSG